MENGTSMIWPLRLVSASGMAITRGRTVAIWGRCRWVRMVHSREPPKVGRVEARLRLSASITSSVQSATRPVFRVVATEPARSRPRVEAPSMRISGW